MIWLEARRIERFVPVRGATPEGGRQRDSDDTGRRGPEATVSDTGGIDLLLWLVMPCFAWKESP